jgi:hypothetical protein
MMCTRKSIRYEDNGFLPLVGVNHGLMCVLLINNRPPSVLLCILVSELKNFPQFDYDCTDS